VRAAGIAQWTGTAGTIQIAADGTGPVRLRISYTRRDGEEGAARTVRRETRTLSGSTAYTVGVTHSPAKVACGERAYAGILVMTEPAAANGPQVSEAPMDGPACATPTATRSATPPPTPTPSPEQSTPALSGSKAPDEPLAQPSDEPDDEPLAQPSDEPPTVLTAAPPTGFATALTAGPTTGELLDEPLVPPSGELAD
jgi:serine/threonine-protein kinase